MKRRKAKPTECTPAVRTLQTVAEDMLWPDMGPNEPDPTKDRRRSTLAHVLCRIPEDDYRRLAGAIDSLSWFIPPAWKRASCELFPATWEESPRPSQCISVLHNGKRVTVHAGGLQSRPIRGARVLYFSPMLERTADDVLTAIIAHELAHVVLNHSMTPGTKYDQQEEEANRLVCHWGYEREQRRHEASKRRRGLK